MKSFLLVLFSLLNSLCLSTGTTTLNENEIDLIKKIKLRKFVRAAGSEEKAIDKLMNFCVPDTIYNGDDYIWTVNKTVEGTYLTYYSSCKMQAFYWIVRIYRSDYKSKEFCRFIDDKGEPVSDYMDVDVDKKQYYWQVILASPTDSRPYYEELGYMKTNSDSYCELDRDFEEWYKEMKIKGLQYMRDNNIPPVYASRYKVLENVK